MIYHLTMNINDNISLCIPKVHKKYDYKRIFQIINKYKIGKIETIDIIPYHRESHFNKVVIHFTFWNQTKKNLKINTHLINGGNIKILYDEPWFWKCYKYINDK